MEAERRKLGGEARLLLAMRRARWGKRYGNIRTTRAGTPEGYPICPLTWYGLAVLKLHGNEEEKPITPRSVARALGIADDGAAIMNATDGHGPRPRCITRMTCAEDRCRTCRIRALMLRAMGRHGRLH